MIKNTLLNDLEKKQSPINFEKDQPILKTDITILEYYLLDIEFWALKEAFRSKTPLSTGQYYNRRLISEYLKMLNNDLGRKINTINHESKKFLIDGKLIEQTDKFKIDMVKLRTKKTIDLVESGLTAKEIREIESYMRQKGVKFPSYKKIKSVLDNLESYGFFCSRKAQDSKANAYWYINPQFIIKYGEAFRKQYPNA